MRRLSRGPTARLPVGMLLEGLGNVQYSHPPSNETHTKGKVHPQSPGPVLQERLPHRRNIAWRLAKFCHTPRRQRCIVEHLRRNKRKEGVSASMTERYDLHEGRRRET